MSKVIDEYLAEVGRSVRVEPARRRAIVAELRAHLVDKMRDEKRRFPARSDDEIARAVVADFGDPRELAVAYDGSGAALVQRVSTGEVVLRVGRAAGRGMKAVAKWFAIVVACLLVLAIALGGWVYYEVKPIVAENTPYPIYSTSKSCKISDCASLSEAQRFHVHENAREVRMSLKVDAEKGLGNVNIVVKDPAGRVKYDQSFASSGTSAQRTTEHLTWGPEPGEWSIAYRYMAFQGNVSVEIFAVGLPPGALG